MINIAIIDNIEAEASITKKLIENYAEENGENIKTFIFNEGINFISDYVPKFDLILIEVDLPHINGIAIAKKLRKIDSDVGIIFVTNKAQYAIYGYEVDAIDYILKPLDYASFLYKFDRALKKLKRKECKKINVFVDGQHRCFSVKDICYIEVMGHMLAYHLKDEVINCRGNLGEVEKVLVGEDFMRIYKSYIINFAFVEKVGQRTIIINGEELLLSRSKKREFLKTFDIYLSKYSGMLN